MAHHTSRFLRVVRWQHIRWGLVFPALTFALWACNSHELQVPKPRPQQQTDFEILVSPDRMVDIVFLIDNSPSMDPKQRALAANFPRMIDVLKKLDGGLPDVRIAVVSSDMGAGGGEAGGNCQYVLGNQGIFWGNDPDADPNFQNNKYATVKHIKNGCGLNSGARWIQDGGSSGGSKNYQGDISEVFSCLATAVGVNGCGYEHQLQALRVALNPIVGDEKSGQPPINPQNVGFLRSKAYLAIVIIADEDDCSADPNFDTNDGMFFPRTLGDTASLRCATRGHVCNGQAIPNYDPNTGYTGDQPFVADFSKCDAKEDGDWDNEKKPRDYKWLPLIRVRDMVDSVLQVKPRPQEQILVSGIIGWPEGSLDGVQYRIDKDKTSMPVEQQNLWDYMPICTLPTEKSADGNIYRAYGGFRLKKFLDAFKREDANLFSLCNTANFPDAMTQIANAIVKKLKPGCVTYPLIDTDSSEPDIQPECQVLDKIVCDTPGKGECLRTGYIEKPLPECRTRDNKRLDPNNPDLNSVNNDDISRPCWYLVYDKDPNAGCPHAFRNQKITALRKDNKLAPPGTVLGMQCLTCALPITSSGQSPCPALDSI